MQAQVNCPGDIKLLPVLYPLILRRNFLRDYIGRHFGRKREKIFTPDP